MRTIPHNIQNAYYKLKKSRLVKENIIDSDSLLHFESVLNSGLPKSNDEFVIYYFIKNLFYNDKSKFYNFINNSGFECLVLYTDNLCISNHFNLVSTLYVSCNKDDQLYNIKKIIN